MAYKTVVINPLVEQLTEFVKRTSEVKGKYALAMLVPSETLADKWNLVLSASWIDNSGLRAAIPTVTSLLRKYLSKLNASKIERISVVPTADSLVRELMSLGIGPGTAYRVQELALTARGLDEAIILAAQRPDPGGYHRTQPVRSHA